MKIEAGKYYRTRGGEVVQVRGNSSHYSSREYPFEYNTDKNHLTVTECGHHYVYRNDGESKFDLIEEVHPNATPDPSADIPTTFYLVWNERTGSCVKRHDTKNLAIEEAERLAKKQVGDTFVVLQALYQVKAEAMVTTTGYRS